MGTLQLGIYPLFYDAVTDHNYLMKHIYPDMERNYYWSTDFSPSYYIAQAKAGFIAVTDIYQGEELLLPEIQYSYAILHFEDLHISKKVQKLLRRKHLQLTIDTSLEKIAEAVRNYHQNCWLTPKYLQILIQTTQIREDFQPIAAYIEENGKAVAGEIGYIIGDTYTSLTGFSSRDKAYRNYGTAQLVLLAHYLQENGFAFWNLGQSYMPYKFHLGAKEYSRMDFLKLWFSHI